MFVRSSCVIQIHLFVYVDWIKITATLTQLNSFIPHFPLPLLNIVTVYCVELKEMFIDFTRHKSLVVYGELTDFFLLSVESI